MTKPEARRRSEPPAPRTISEIPPPLHHDPRAEPDAAERSPSSRPPLAVDMPGAEPLRPSRVFPAVNVAEQKLLEELNGGNVNAGIELMNQLENRSSRSHDLVNVARRVVALVPGDTSLLRRLYEAALSDKNIVYARALEHALAIFDRSVAPVRPPALLEQPEDPEPVRALLFRDIEGTAAEALALVWEGAAHVFRRDPSTYGVTGLERVPLGAPTPLGRIYSGVARALGVSRTPLFQRRTAGPVTLSVALLAPPAVIVAGEVTRESPALAFHLGAMLAAALPEHVLTFGTPESQTRGILKGLALAFGRPNKRQERPDCHRQPGGGAVGEHSAASPAAAARALRRPDGARLRRRAGGRAPIRPPCGAVRLRRPGHGPARDARGRRLGRAAARRAGRPHPPEPPRSGGGSGAVGHQHGVRPGPLAAGEESKPAIQRELGYILRCRRALA